MDKENIKQQGNQASNVIEDLTLNETEAGDVKGGAFDAFLTQTSKKRESGITDGTINGGSDLKVNMKW